MFKIEMLEYEYGNEKPVGSDEYEVQFYTREEALVKAEELAKEEAVELNKNAFEESGEEACIFEAAECGDDEYDFETRCMDGDDYKIVTKYRVVPGI